mmetsp:Transcript_3781/g.13981  ORF Transcript_3781/g.13981 Transcript_3781/m.13981 type:complete len:223 (-) Transcript_3781:408-1076(-)
MPPVTSGSEGSADPAFPFAKLCKAASPPISNEARSTNRFARNGVPCGNPGRARCHSCTQTCSFDELPPEFPELPTDPAEMTHTCAAFMTTFSEPDSDSSAVRVTVSPANGARIGVSGNLLRTPPGGAGAPGFSRRSSPGSGPSAGAWCGPACATAIGTGDAPLQMDNVAFDPWNPSAPSPVRYILAAETATRPPSSSVGSIRATGQIPPSGQAMGSVNTLVS